MPCRTSYLGREVPGPRRKGTATVVGCVRPEFGCGTPDLLLKRARGGYTQEPYRRVKDRVHDAARGPLCDRSYSASSGLRVAREFAASKPPYRGGELPFPHRKGSSVCCAHSAAYPDTVDEIQRDIRAGRGIYEQSDLGEILDKRLPSAVKARLRASGSYPVSNSRSVAAATKAVRAYCVDLVAGVEARADERAKLSRSQALAKAKAKRRAKAEGKR